MAVDTTRYDLQLDADGDLFLSTAGDLVITPSDEQHIQDATNAGPNWWKQFPDQGGNIGAYQNGSFDQQTLEKKLRLTYQADGYSASPALSYDSAGNLVVNVNLNN